MVANSMLGSNLILYICDFLSMKVGCRVVPLDSGLMHGRILWLKVSLSACTLGLLLNRQKIAKMLNASYNIPSKGEAHVH
jgi:hypothetical protein